MGQNFSALTSSIIKHIYVFYICSKHLNFTNAGLELNITQSAISKSIKKLEETLGVKLFLRKKNHITLSSEGKKLFKQIKYLCFELNEQIAKTINQNQHNTINFTTLPSCSNYWLNNIIHDFAQIHKNIKFKVNIFKDLITDPIDENSIVICCEKNTHRIEESYNFIKIFDEKIVPICKPELITQYQNTKSLILNSKLIVHSSRDNPWPNILKDLNIDYNKIQSHLELEHFYMIIDTVIQNDSIGLVPEQYITKLIKEKKLIIPFNHNFKSNFSYYLCIPKNKNVSSASNNFFNWFKKIYC
ncbi:LysR family transcriptional regulator [Rickettsiales bacterium]|nr:LysR family transcriptional regulator [Rickettsiales bacterium]